MAAEIRIGTSGWHYPHWRGPFYPERFSGAKMLGYYIASFNTVEVNNSFYKLPSAEAFRCWRDSSPRNFCFAVKASRFITHNKKLKDPENPLERFFSPVSELREKLGPILFQLPPKWRVNVERLEEFLCALPKGKRWRYAFEFREPTWLNEKVYKALRRHNAALCIYELAGFRAPDEITADWTYLRLHGPGGKYQGSYSRAQLSEWAERIAHWRERLKAIYVYFDNDEAGYAVQNALELKRLLQGSKEVAA
jgi:uncharacterized protein YecE (DUF72 family)